MQIFCKTYHLSFASVVRCEIYGRPPLFHESHENKKEVKQKSGFPLVKEQTIRNCRNWVLLKDKTHTSLLELWNQILLD